MTPLQLELLKLYGTGLTEAEILEVKAELARHFARKAIEAADRVWDDRGLTPGDMRRWLDE